MKHCLALSLAMLLGITQAHASDILQDWEVTGELAIEPRLFFEEPNQLEQLDHLQLSAYAEVEFFHELWDGDGQLVITPFIRLDAEDSERTHADLREAYVRYFTGDWEFLAGANRVFWGVTESRHLTNIINQVDALENIDEEDFLGQPMIQIARQTDIGRFDAFLMSRFRERRFAGIDGRLRPPVLTSNSEARFESDLEHLQPEIALRYSHFIGDADIGVHVFHGTSREPDLLVPAAGGALVPRYPLITQLGLDLQLTQDAWLWKFEGLVREGQGDTFAAAVGGVEYTLYQFLDSDADLGLLAELLYDGRDATADLTQDEQNAGFVAASVFPTIADNDLFIGARVGLNDTQDTAFLAGGFIDLEDGLASLRVEAERRLTDNWKMEIEANVFVEDDADAAASVFEKDSFAVVRLSRFF